MRKFVLGIFLFLLLLGGGFFYFRHQVYYGHGDKQAVTALEIRKGEGNGAVADSLEQKGLIVGKYQFYYYLYVSGQRNKLMPGNYLIGGNLTIPEIVHIITNPEAQAVRITFPEGLTVEGMAELVTKSGFDGDGFLALADDIPNSLRQDYPFLSDPQIKTLEGYLFPDTYSFKKDATAESIIRKMLDDFAGRTETLAVDIKGQNKSLRDIVIMASLIEKEVPDPDDMKIVSGIFWDRIAVGMALQSDATLSYILKDKTDSHGGSQLEVASPYNTYANKGLPPGPICNPGMNALTAALHPQSTAYAYFLTAGGKVYYAKTYDEHLANKHNAGL